MRERENKGDSEFGNRDSEFGNRGSEFGNRGSERKAETNSGINLSLSLSLFYIKFLKLIFSNL